MVGARFIVHSYAEGAAKPRPYLRPPCGGIVSPIRYPPTANRLLRHHHHLPLSPQMIPELAHVDPLDG